MVYVYTTHIQSPRQSWAPNTLGEHSSCKEWRPRFWNSRPGARVRHASRLLSLSSPPPHTHPFAPNVWLHFLWQSALSWTGHNGSGRKCRHCLLISKISTFKLSPSYHVLSACGKANSWLQLSDFLKVLICSFNRANDETIFPRVKESV